MGSFSGRKVRIVTGGHRKSASHSTAPYDPPVRVTRVDRGGEVRRFMAARQPPIVVNCHNEDADEPPRFDAVSMSLGGPCALQPRDHWYVLKPNH